VTRELAGRTAVITGAASGIGLSLADRLSLEDMNLVLADVDTQRLQPVVDRLRAAGRRVIGVPTDVTEPADLDELAAVTVAEFGMPFVTCANAGVNRFASFQDLTLNDWQWIIGVNLMGVVHTVRSFLPLLLQGRGGGLAITASMASIVSGVNRSAYSATKHAVLAIADSLTDELAADQRSDIGVTLLCPGPVRTDIADCGRHRPGGAAPTEQDERFARYLAESGLDADEVASLLIEGIKAGRRYVFTHPRLARDALGDRHAAFVAGLEDRI
jgi:short-subunit dehydrogenase